MRANSWGVRQARVFHHLLDLATVISGVVLLALGGSLRAEADDFTQGQSTPTQGQSTPTQGQSTPTQGQSTNEGLQEVVVTAQRREEKLLDVPMTVQAFDQQSLDQLGIRSIDDLTRVAPGVTFLRVGASSSSNYNDENSDISINGVDSSAGAATTAIYLDDSPIQIRHIAGDNPSPFPALFDLERVEVLKGPQGTLFGSGSEGGAVRFITPETSTTTYSGYARAEVGQIDGGGQNYDVGAAFGGPLIDGVLGFRATASFRQDGGWVDRVDYARPASSLEPCTGCISSPAAVYSESPAVTGISQRNANWHDTSVFRLALKWTPFENLSVDPSFYYQLLHINDTGAYWVNLSDPGQSDYNNGNAARDSSTDPWSLSAVKVSWELPWAYFFSNTSYLARDQHSESDYTQFIDTLFLSNQYPAIDGPLTLAPFKDHQRTFTQEVRLSSKDTSSPLQWIGGVFYTHSYENLASQIEGPILSDDIPVNSSLDQQLAGFGEVSYKIYNELTFTAGLRYAQVRYTGKIESISDDTPRFAPSVSSDNKPVTPRFVLKYQPVADSLVYASAAKGFRPGSANAPFAAATVKACGTQSVADVAPDSVWQYELGTKNTLAEDRLQISASIYYLRWEQIQQQVNLACGAFFTANLGTAVGKGGDITVAWRPISDLTLGLTAAYTDTVYQDIVTFQGLVGSYTGVRNGNHLPAYPWNGDANAEYSWTGETKKPYIRVDYQFTTAQNSLLPSQDPANAPQADPTIPGLPSVRMLSGRVGVRFNGLDISAFVQNALNFHTPTLVARDFATTAIDGVQPDFDTNYFARGYPPRTIGLTTTYRF